MNLSHSQLLARALAGSWRDSPPLELNAAQWETLAPLLIGSGAGGLGWRVARAGECAMVPAVDELREIHHAQALKAMFREQEIAATFARLHEHSVEAILLKGWSVARCYPEAGLRPLGDIDVLVQPEHRELAGEVLGLVVDNESGAAHLIDAKSKLRPIYGFDAGAVWQARQTVELHGTPISLLCEEDQLRMLCLHFLRHGAWRPLWLCDIAVALEARSPAFDWTRCLGRDRRRADAIACTLGLAHQLLDAHADCKTCARAAVVAFASGFTAVGNAAGEAAFSASFYDAIAAQRRGERRDWPTLAQSHRSRIDDAHAAQLATFARAIAAFRRCQWTLFQARACTFTRERPGGRITVLRSAASTCGGFCSPISTVVFSKKLGLLLRR